MLAEKFPNLSQIKAEGHNYLGQKTYDEMPELYQKYQNLIINPLWPEPFGRFLAESTASGCNIMKFPKSHLTGFESYGLEAKEMLDKCYRAPASFWREVCEVLEDEFDLTTFKGTLNVEFIDENFKKNIFGDKK